MTRIIGPCRLRAGRLGVALVFLTFGVLAASSSGVRAADSDDSDDTADARLYAGTGLNRVSFDDAYNGVSLDDISTGFVAYLGFRLREQLSLEVSYDASDAIDRSDVAGSGIVRFDVVNERRTVAISALRELSLQELFGWRHDWRVFGVVGVYRSDLDRTATILGSNQQTASGDEITGALLGAGFLRRIGPIEVRGYVRTFGVLDAGEASETGATVQFRF
jgi:hypothetical protein